MTATPSPYPDDGSDPPAAAGGRPLADFRTDRRVLVLTALAIPIGAISALVARALLWLIAAITNLAFFLRFSVAPVVPQDHRLGWWVVAVPVIGAVIVGLMARYGTDKIRGHGIPEALEAILLGRSLIRLKVAILKPLSSALSIGTGGPFGAEGPIIMTGGAFGSLFAQMFRLTAAERKTLLVAGAAGGMAGIFATPVAAVLLAIELLLFEWKPRSFIPVAVAAVVATGVREPLLGAGPIFPVPAHAVPGAAILALAAVVGIVAGLGSSLLTALVYACEDLFQKLPVHWMWWPALGALVVGLGGAFDPRVLGVGYATIHGLLRGDVVGWAAGGLLFAKALVWSAALGSGTSGGVLAPLLITGGALGAVLGGWMPAGDAGTWALVGMAAVMAGTMRAPLTGTVFAIELTHDLNLFPAVLIGCAASFCVAVLLMRRSILTEKLARRGQHIAYEYAVDPFELMRVGDVMDGEPPTISARTTIAELSDRIARRDDPLARRHATLIVNDAGDLTGIITRGDIMQALGRDPGGATTVAEAGTTQVIVARSDESLHQALEKMLRHDIGRLPVISPENPVRVVGYLGRAEILRVRRRVLDEEGRRERGTMRARNPASLAKRA